jgi:hypothetical protein
MAYDQDQQQDEAEQACMAKPAAPVCDGETPEQEAPGPTETPAQSANPVLATVPAPRTAAEDAAVASAKIPANTAGDAKPLAVAARTAPEMPNAQQTVDGSTKPSGAMNVSVAPDKASFGVDGAVTKKITDDAVGTGGNIARVGASVTGSNGNATFTGTAGTENRTATDMADGGTRTNTTKKDASFSYGTDGSYRGSLGVSGGTEEAHVVDNKEVRTGSSMGVTGGFGRDADGTNHATLAGNASNTTLTPDGKPTTTSGSAGIDASFGEGREGLSGNAALEKDGKRVAVSGGYNTTFTKPTQNDDGTWTVPYSSTANASGEAGAGDKARISGSVGGSTSTFGSRSFATEEDAKAFYAKGDVPAQEMPTTATAAKDLPAGTTIGTAGTANYGLSVGTNSGGIGGSVGGETHSGQSIAVTAKGGGVVEVTTAQGDGHSGTIGISGGGASASVGSGSDRDTSKRVQFDLNSAEGQAAYEQYLKDPSKVPDAAKVTQTTEHDKESTKTQIAFAGAAMGDSHAVDQTVVRDGDGNIISRDQKGTQSDSVSFLGYHTNEQAVFDIATANGKVTYTARKDIDDTLATDANSALARATNSTADVNVSGASQGKYHVDTTYNENQMETFAEQVKSGAYNKPLGTVGDAARDELKTALVAAGNDPVKRKAALAQFVATGGDAALSQVKDATGVDGQHDVMLEGDRFLTGAAGRKEVSNQIDAYEQQVYAGKSDASTVGDVRALLAEQKERQRALADPANYRELPSDVRAKEVARSKADVDKLETVLATAKDDQRVYGPDTDESQQADDKGQARMQDAAADMAQARADTDAAYAAARFQNKVHDGYYSQSARTMREQFGDKDFGLIDNTETQAYASADKALAEGRKALAEANKQEATFDRRGDDTSADVDASAEAASKAAAAHRLAAQKFAEAQRTYQDIAARQQSDAKPGSLDGLNHPLKPGE